MRIANVNIGTAAAEIGGAFGGESPPAAAENPAPTLEKLHAAAAPIR